MLDIDSFDKDGFTVKWEPDTGAWPDGFGLHLLTFEPITWRDWLRHPVASLRAWLRWLLCERMT